MQGRKERRGKTSSLKKWTNSDHYPLRLRVHELFEMIFALVRLVSPVFTVI
jgi:hypothetical protein